MARKKLIENMLSLGAVQLASYVLPLISLPYLARTLGADQLGRVAFALAVAQVLVVLTDYGFNLSAPKAVAVHRHEPSRVALIWCSVTLLRTVFALFGMALLLIGVLLVERLRQEWLLLFICYTTVIGNVLFPQWLFQGLEQLRVVSMVQIVARVLVFATIFVLVHSPDDLYIAAWLQSAGTLLGGLMALPHTLRALGGAHLVWPGRDMLREQLREGWPVFLSTAAINVYTSCNAFFLGLFATPAALAHYHIAEKLIRAVQMLLGPVSNAVYPHVSRLAADDPAAALRFNRRLLLGLGGFGACITAGVLLLAPWVIETLFGSSYLPAVPVLQAFAWLPLLIAVSNVLGIQTMLPLGMQHLFSRVLMSAALVDFIVFIPAAYYFGALGAAWANVAVEFYVSAAMALVLHRASCSPLSTPSHQFRGFKHDY